MKHSIVKARVTNLGVLLLLVFGVTQFAKADFIFGEPENPGAPLNSSHADGTTCLAPDGLSFYFGSDRPGGYGMYDMWVATRPTTGDDWGTPVNLGSAVNASADDGCPSVSADGLELYFTSDRPGGYGSFDIWVTTRPSVLDPWGEPVNLGQTVNSSHFDATPSLSFDGLSLYFGSNREKTGTAYSHLCYIYVTTRPTRTDPWGPPVRLGSTVNPGLEYDADHPSISPDGRVLFFTSNRPGSIGDSWDLWMAARPTADAEWATAVNLGPAVNDSLNDRWPNISPDGSTLFFLSERAGGLGGEDIWQVPIEPIVDFNGDGAVDCLDVCDLIDHWCTDNSLYDVGPTPFGDGVVDAQDLIILAEHMTMDADDSDDVE